MKELLEGFLSRMETESVPKEGEYLGEDGLLYCVIHRIFLSSSFVKVRINTAFT